MRNIRELFEQTSLSRVGDPKVASDLNAPEMIILWTLRSWVWETVAHGKVGATFAERFADVDCLDAAPPLASFLEIVGSVAIRRIQIHKPCCSQLGSDEKRFLHVFEAQQNGRALEAFEALSQLLPPTAVRVALDHALKIAQCFGRSGMFLAERNWNLPELSPAHRLRAPLAITTDIRKMIH